MADIPKGQLDQYLLDTLFFKEYTLGIPGFSLGALDRGGVSLYVACQIIKTSLLHVIVARKMDLSNVDNQI